jgi:ribosomal protein S4
MVPSRIEFDQEKKTGTIKSMPTSEDVELKVALPQIVEYYSR